MGQLKGWLASHAKMGAALKQAADAYSEATDKLSDNNQSVIKKIQKLEKLGLSPKRSQGRIKTTSRTMGPESIIPTSLLQGNEVCEEQPQSQDPE